MLVLALTVVAAILLGHGYLAESPEEVIAAGVISVLSVLAVLVDRIRSRQHRGDSEPTGDETAAAEEVETDLVGASASKDDGDRVVFVPGRMTFHHAECGAVADKQTSAADRAELELGGMRPCRRCIPEEPTAGQGPALRLA